MQVLWMGTAAIGLMVLAVSLMVGPFVYMNRRAGRQHKIQLPTAEESQSVEPFLFAPEHHSLLTEEGRADRVRPRGGAKIAALIGIGVVPLLFIGDGKLMIIPILVSIPSAFYARWKMKWNLLLTRGEMLGGAAECTSRTSTTDDGGFRLDMFTFRYVFLTPEGQVVRGSKELSAGVLQEDFSRWPEQNARVPIKVLSVNSSLYFVL